MLDRTNNISKFITRIGGYCNSDKLIITISFLAPLLLVGVILFLVMELRNANTLTN
jgi:hypothetical protein